jgi:hypothetical protein
MNLYNKIKRYVYGYFKKKIIRQELNKFFKMYQKKNNKRLNLLTEALFKASQVIKAELIEKEFKNVERENEILFNDIKTVIEKHYKDRENKLIKENQNLEKKLKEKDRKINDIKVKITDSILE